MKKITLALAVIAALGLVSCNREKEINVNTPGAIGENGVAFVLQGSPLTRSAEQDLPVITTSRPVQVEGSETAFCLEETIEDLNAAFAPATKGTPAYTENVGVLYGSQLGVYAEGKFGNTVFESAGQTGDGWSFHHNYAGDPWPKENTNVDFYLRMPAVMNGVEDLKYENKSISFRLTSPETAQEQQDLLFATTAVNKTDHKKALKDGGHKVTFYHALTGVKFRIANNSEVDNGKTNQTQTYITKVTLSGLKNSATGVFSDSQFEKWEFEEGTGTFTASFGEDENVTKFEEGGSFESQGEYPESFASAAADNNLNDADASKTFWFIPQELTDEVTLTVEFHVWDGTKNQPTQTLTLNLGERTDGNALTNDWKAGQLRTFSLKPNHVGVDIEDTMSDNRMIKKDVVIRNTGNVPQWVRVNIIGNWVGQRQLSASKDNLSDFTVLMGYTGDTGDDEVARWNDKDGDATWFSPTGKEYPYTPYGTFEGLPSKGTATATASGWIRHDKYYYYIKAIGPGEALDPATAPLFEKYTLNTIPDFWIADNMGIRRKAQKVHLEMDLAVQAIEVKTTEGENAYAIDWAHALGVTVDGLNDL